MSCLRFVGKKFLVAMLTLMFGLAVTANAQTKSVLFLGNSLTYTGNGVHNDLRSIAASLGDDLFVDANNVGAATFRSHSVNATSLAKISSRQWDFVVLQGQSQEPSFPPQQVAEETYPYAKILSDSVHNNSPCTQLLFFMSWGRPAGDQNNCASYPEICTFDGIQQRLRQSYLEMAADNDAWAVPCGIAFADIFHNHPDINLFSDDIHPSPAGTYLAACTFYAAIFHKSPVGATYVPAAIPANDATLLQSVAWNVVNDSLDIWLIDTTHVHANFQIVAHERHAEFQNLSLHADSCLWLFGDGSQLVQYQNVNGNFDNVSHTFPDSVVTCDVRLTAYKKCTADSVRRQMQFAPAEQPAVAVSLRSATPTTLDVGFEPNTACPSFHYLCSTATEMDNWVNTLATPLPQLIRSWGIRATAACSHVFTDLVPDTEYTVYVLPVDAQGVDCQYVTTCFRTAIAGGPGEAVVDIRLSEITDTSVHMQVVKNDQTAAFHDGLITTELFNHIGRDSAVSIIQHDGRPLYENDSWTWTSLQPGTAYKAIAIAKNARRQWGSPCIVDFATTAVTANLASAIYDLRIFPSPSHGTFLVDATDLPNAHNLLIINMLGEVVYRVSVGTGVVNVDLGRAVGVYLLQVCDGSGRVVAQRRFVVW